ncbi:MAG: hypothetical protein JWP36_803 [Paucimonas sp.]|jgi:putative membrane protein|nr:hypothetical protein [Paucimonas sp.]
MKILSRIVAALLFIVFFGFALKNTDDATLRLFPGYAVHGPLVLLLLGFFASGAVLGVLAMTPTVFRYRRELNRQKRSSALVQQEAEAQQAARANPPRPEDIA